VLFRSEGGRFKGSDYARFIGRGNGHPKARHGGFVIEMNQSKNVARNGHYELVISQGIKGNVVTEEFTAKLYSYPANGQKTPVISYPPLQGERAEHRKGLKLTRNDSVIEVASMSGMMKASLLGTPQTPAVQFKLVDLLRKECGQSQESGGNSSDSSDADMDDEDPVEENTSAILGDEEEFDADD